ncbi:glucans biosynthesis glucosyltransferase MdoH [Acuticoccus yangtzensis]|uniref:glucans biosynthesis glucosyltransferase MdoH n=1 Tax=Acuticoccus yangtzensis TaxID=1443441 RepID=UPI000A967D9D|nr:glucans biosynthesis glucosyltransferase MdoH [Acuticoccus yangtzensis]
MVEMTPAGKPAWLSPLREISGGDDLPKRLFRRRIIFAVLNLVTVAGLGAAMAGLMFGGGISLSGAVMWVAFVITLPWLSIGFWNAIIGTLLIARGPVPNDPLALDEATGSAITTRTAIAMTLRNEDVAVATRRLKLMFEELEAEGEAEHFDIHILSDTNDPAIAAEEVDTVARWRRESARPGQIFYRRRMDNAGYKAGNIQEFCGRHANDYTFFLTLDADSYMSARTVLRLVRTMQAAPRVGILQTLAIGTPSTSMFTRTFQFGMRHGMRAFTAGSVWWTGDCGPYWGHNALIRMAPFHAHCHLPVLSGTGPLGGAIMSHDQVEAVMMRRCGYHVRVIAEESESWEENPPTLPDYVRRDLRWCQGNFQYLWLIGMPGLKPISRLQLALAVVMFLGAPAWMTFIVLGALTILGGGVAGVPEGWGLALVGVVLFMCFAPKIMGLLATIASPNQSRRYGGRVKTALGGLFELFASTLMAPAVAFATAVFAFGLLFGKRIEWQAQARSVRSITWGEALSTFLPQTLFGTALLVIILSGAPQMIWFALPVVAGLVLAAPFAVVTAHPAVGRAMTRAGICAIPEEHAEPVSLTRLRQTPMPPAEVQAAAA